MTDETGPIPTEPIVTDSRGNEITSFDEWLDEPIPWSERLMTPVYIAKSVWHSLGYELRRPRMIDHGISSHRDEGKSLVFTSGPLWLWWTTQALYWADLLTGHEWCNMLPGHHEGLMDMHETLSKRYGTKMSVFVADDTAEEFAKLLGYHPYCPCCTDDDEEAEEEVSDEHAGTLGEPGE